MTEIPPELALPRSYSSSRVILVRRHRQVVARHAFTPALSLVLSILDNIQHRFMAISALDASLPALKDLITLVQAVPLPKSGPRDILLLRKLNDYEDEVEYTCISLGERGACKM
jgi:hypothetical protein